jgi:Fic family protein
MAIQYQMPSHWIKYDPSEIINELTEAKAAVLSLTSIPFQRSWAEALQEIELKREVAGTSKIEGADFTEREFEEAVAGKADEKSLSRSQKQARAAINTYRWIAKLPSDFAIGTELVHDIHRHIVTGCDEDHCAPGELRGGDQNVTFGKPRHRGATGGAECTSAFKALFAAVNSGEFRKHDGLVQALAVHYHIGAIHPYQDGNGRTARALEALLLKRGGLKDTLFIAMSNYYYDEKDAYLSTLSLVANSKHDLTQFLKFGLRGIAAQAHRLLREIRRHVSRSLYREVMAQMYGRLQSTRKRALAHRQLAILETLLNRESTTNVEDLMKDLDGTYSGLTESAKAFVRDLNQLIQLGALEVTQGKPLPGRTYYSQFTIFARLDWPTEITETKFYEEINKMPQAKTRLLHTSWHGT